MLWNGPSRLGEKLGWEWLVYNPGVFLEFDMVARRNAPIFAGAVCAAFSGAVSVCDLGAGTGQYVKAFEKHGKVVDGFEYSWQARRFAKVFGVHLGDFDLTKDPAIDSETRYDLIYSVEVGEHIPESLSDAFVESLVSRAPVVIVTCAQPGQRGHGHINCQPRSYWIDKFEERGFVHNDGLRDSISERIESSGRASSFLYKNLMVFESHGTT